MQSPNAITILLFVGLFAVVFAGALGAMLLLAPRDMRRRIEQAGGVRGAPSSAPLSTGAAWLQKISDISQPIAKLSIPKENKEQSGVRRGLIKAGWRPSGAARAD